MPVERSRTSLHPVITSDGPQTLDLPKWCREKSLDGYVRFQNLEWSNLPPPRENFLHINMHPCNFEPGLDYAGLQIAAPGKFTAELDLSPTLLADIWLKIKCLATKNLVTPADFLHMDISGNDLGANTSSQLLDLVWAKYRPVIPALEKNTFLANGFCVTTFQVVSAHSGLSS